MLKTLSDSIFGSSSEEPKNNVACTKCGERVSELDDADLSDLPGDFDPHCSKCRTDEEMPQLQQVQEEEEQKPVEEEQIIDESTDDIALQANCLGCGASISFGKDADITQAYCSDECKPSKVCKTCGKSFKDPQFPNNEYCDGYCYMNGNPTKPAEEEAGESPGPYDPTNHPPIYQDEKKQKQCNSCKGTIKTKQFISKGQFFYCSIWCSTRPRDKSSNAKPDSNMPFSTRDHCVRCSTPVNDETKVQEEEGKIYCSEDCKDKAGCDTCGSAGELLVPVESGKYCSTDCVPVAKCKYCDEKIGEEIIFNHEDDDVYCSEKCKNDDQIKYNVRGTRSRNRTISSDRQIMFNRLESNIEKSIAGHDVLEQPRLTDHEKAQIRISVQKDYRSIPDTQLSDKQNFIIYKVPVKVKKVMGLYQKQKRDKLRESQELRKKLLEEKIAARALKRAENKRKAQANKKEKEPEPVKSRTEGMTLVF
jgi:hypothetical protein